jgi:DNA helicase HerA-like ATPase
VVKGKDYQVKVIGRVVEIVTDNALLSIDNAKLFVEEDVVSRVGDFFKSSRFKTYLAKCEVIGKFNPETKSIEPLDDPVETGADVYEIDKSLLEALFFSPSPSNLFPGYIKQLEGARFSLKGDDILTMHCGIFGMTGMGKTTTTGTLLEELTVRGAKGLVFDPHGDYRNLGILKDELFEAVKEELDRGPIKRLLEELKSYLSSRWTWYSSKVKGKLSPHLEKALSEEIKRELKAQSLVFRLMLIASVLRKQVVDTSSPRAFKEQFLSLCSDLTLDELKEKVPQGILTRLFKLVIEGFPTVKIDDFFTKYFVLNMIEAYSGEEFTEVQEGYLLEWLDEIDSEISDLKMIEFLRFKVGGLQNKSKAPIIRKLDKWERLYNELSSKKELIPVDSKLLVKSFGGKDGELSFVSNLIFDLSRVSPETIQRALLYSMAYSAFNLYKSGELSFEKGDSPLLFVIEEARVLIPKSGAEDLDHPASRFARNIVRRIATEGRKMALGLLIVSQKPASVDPLPVSQCNTLILHRVVNPEDLSFVKSVGEAISEEDLNELKRVERGISIVTGTALKLRKSLLVRFRNRLSKEGREHPKPLEKMWGGGS